MFDRIDGFAMDTKFKMHMVASRIAASANPGNSLSLFYNLPDVNQIFKIVCISGLNARAMPDDD